MAREVGLPRTEAERALQTATSTFSLHREIPTTDVRRALEAVREHVEGSPLAPPHDHPARRRHAAAYPHRHRGRGDGGRARRHRDPGDRRRRRTPHARRRAHRVRAADRPGDADGGRPPRGHDARRPTPSPSWCPPAAPGRSRAPTTTPPAPVWSRPARAVGTPCRTAARTAPWCGSSPRSAAGAARPGPTVAQTAEAARNDRAAAPRLQRGDRLVRRLPRRPDAAAADVRPARGRRRGDALHAARLGRNRTPTSSPASPAPAASPPTTVQTSSTAKGAKPTAVAELLARGVDQLCALPEGGTCSTDPTPKAVDADPRRPGPRHARRGRPAARRRGQAPVGRHRAAPRARQRGRDPLRRDRLRRPR